MKIRIYGASDDLIEVEGCEGADEFNSYERGPVMWRGDLHAPDGDAMRAYALYDGCWSIALGQVDEGKPLPDWDIEILQIGRYSSMAQIDAPEGTKLVDVWPTSGEEDD